MAKGEIVGVRVRLAADAIDFYKGNTLVHTCALPVSGASWHFAVSLASTLAGDLTEARYTGGFTPPAAAFPDS